MKGAIHLKIVEIAGELKKQLLEKEMSAGLLSGQMGIALFFSHYALYTNAEYDIEFAHELIENTLTRFSDSSYGYTFSNGISGMGWFLEHLKTIDFIDVDAEALFEDIDNILQDKMHKELIGHNYDFLHGGLGIFYYLLNRNHDSNLEKMFVKTIQALDDISKSKGDKLAWLDYDAKKKQSIPDTYNLGLAHGVPGIISILSKAYFVVPCIKDSIYLMIRNAVNFIIWRFENSNRFNRESYFPYAYNELHPEDTNSRLAWCYGDLGVALALRSANLVLKDRKVEMIINQILMLSVKRQNIGSTRLYDAGICHGTAGVAHIYNSFYNESKLDYLKDASDFWFNVSLTQANFTDGLAGFKAFRNDIGYVNSASFLEGIAGIGLTYITFLNNDFRWDKSLLITI